MSMRLYSEQEFHIELNKMGLTVTYEKTKYSQVWQDKNFEPITIPLGLETYPDYLLDEIRRYIERNCTDGSSIEQKLYAVEGGKKS